MLCKGERYVPSALRPAKKGKGKKKKAKAASPTVTSEPTEAVPLAGAPKPVKAQEGLPADLTNAVAFFFFPLPFVAAASFSSASTSASSSAAAASAGAAAWSVLRQKTSETSGSLTAARHLHEARKGCSL